MSLELILPFLQPPADLIEDPGISEIMFNPDGLIFIESGGILERVSAVLPEGNVQFATKRMAHLADHEITEASPIVEVQLSDGSRISETCPPASSGGTIRFPGS